MTLLSGGDIGFDCESGEERRAKCLNGSKRLNMCVLTTGAAGEAAVVVEATHSLAGLVGSIDCLVAFNADPWNTTQRTNKTEVTDIYINMKHTDGFTHIINIIDRNYT